MLVTWHGKILYAVRRKGNVNCCVRSENSETSSSLVLGTGSPISMNVGCPHSALALLRSANKNNLYSMSCFISGWGGWQAIQKRGASEVPALNQAVAHWGLWAFVTAWGCQGPGGSLCWDKAGRALCGWVEVKVSQNLLQTFGAAAPSNLSV